MPRTSASRGWSWGKRYRRNSPVTTHLVADHGVGEHAEPVDLDLDDVAGLQQPRWRAGVADPGRSAGGQQVTGPQGEGAGDQRQGVPDGVDHLVGATVLDGL